MNSQSTLGREFDTTPTFINWKPYDQNIKNTVTQFKYVVFFGCGAIFASIVETWHETIGKKIDFCSDNNPAKWGQYFCNVPCISPAELATIKEECVVFLTIGNFIPAYDQLLKAGIKNIHLIYKYDLEAAIYIRSSDSKHLGHLANSARKLMADEQSLKIFDAILDRSSGTNKSIDLMAEIYEPAQYFPPDIIQLSDHESFVDVGAYDGDTILQFLQASKNKFNQIHGFELDQSNFIKLKDTIDQNSNKNSISVYNMGAWDSNGIISYQPGLTQSTIGKGVSSGSVVRLDDILNEKDVTYIKMDIEGAEINALNGAEKIIRQSKPKLAICIYHHISHLWEIPLLIHKMLPEHHIYLRHHTRLEYETVCYAIPCTRN